MHEPLTRAQVETTISRFLSWHACEPECDHDLRQVDATDAALRAQLTARTVERGEAQRRITELETLNAGLRHANSVFTRNWDRLRDQLQAKVDTSQQQLNAMTEQYITERTANAKAQQEIERLKATMRQYVTDSECYCRDEGIALPVPCGHCVMKELAGTKEGG